MSLSPTCPFRSIVDTNAEINEQLNIHIEGLEKINRSTVKAPFSILHTGLYRCQGEVCPLHAPLRWKVRSCTENSVKVMLNYTYISLIQVRSQEVPQGPVPHC